MDVRYSAVATVYNDADAVVQLLDDVCSQTVKPTEFVIADGGSKDKTVAIINEYAKNSSVPIRVLSGKRLNISQGFNVAIRNARCDIILISAVGNRYPSDFAYKLAKVMCEKNADVAYPDVSVMPVNEFAKKYYEQIMKVDGACATGIAMNHGSMVSRFLFARIGLFYEHFHYAGEDLEFMWRAVEEGASRVYVGDVAVRWAAPSNLDEYRRQLEVYTIAAFQLWPYKMLALTFLGGIYHLGPAVWRIMRQGGASLRDYRRVGVIKCFLLNWRFLLPCYHYKRNLVPKL